MDCDFFPNQDVGLKKYGHHCCKEYMCSANFGVPWFVLLGIGQMNQGPPAQERDQDTSLWPEVCGSPSSFSSTDTCPDHPTPDPPQNPDCLAGVDQPHLHLGLPSPEQGRCQQDREGSRWWNRRMRSSSLLTSTSRIHLQMEQFSQSTC